jgi:ferredoxin-nitrate reductase
MAKADWEIFAEVGRRLGFTEQFTFSNSAEVYAEFVQLTRDRLCDHSGISHERLKTEGPIQWPCPEKGSREKAKAKRLYTNLQFPHRMDALALLPIIPKDWLNPQIKSIPLF